MSDSSPITKAIAELQTERAHLQARLTKVDEAIATLRDLFHLPTPKPMRPMTAAAASSHDRATAILSALADKPLSPSELGRAVNLNRFTLRQCVKDLEHAGQVVSTGATMNRRFALAAHAAKEAVRR